MNKIEMREEIEKVFDVGNWWIKKELFNYMIENSNRLGIENINFLEKNNEWVIKIDKEGYYLNEMQGRALLLNKMKDELGLNFEIGNILFQMLRNIRIKEGSSILRKSVVTGQVYQGKVIIFRNKNIFDYKIVRLEEEVDNVYEEMHNVTMYQVWNRLNQLNTSSKKHNFDFKKDMLNTDIIKDEIIEEIDIDELWEMQQNGLLNQELI